jgi:2-polyprenyl-6-methoxyphenol hydroxylase-like FAD-dependent oxidoreductase
MPQRGEATFPKRVLVVGAGAAGMACADSMAAHPDKFDVTLIEAQARYYQQERQESSSNN